MISQCENSVLLPAARVIAKIPLQGLINGILEYDYLLRFCFGELLKYCILVLLQIVAK